MKAYELLFFVDPSIEDEQRLATMKRIEDAIKNQGGKIDEVEEWGKKKLAYEINELTDGDYTLIKFQLEPNAVEEINRVLGIMDAVVRHMITVAIDA